MIRSPHPPSPKLRPVWRRRLVVLIGVFVGASIASRARPVGACKCVAPAEIARLELVSAEGSSAETGAELTKWPSEAELRGYDGDADEDDHLFMYVPSDDSGSGLTFSIEGRREGL